MEVNKYLIKEECFSFFANKRQFLLHPAIDKTINKHWKKSVNMDYSLDTKLRNNALFIFASFDFRIFDEIPFYAKFGQN